jgi:hypothetical protein
MGGGTFNTSTYYDAAATRAATNTPSFAYDSATKAKPRSMWKAADSLNIHGKSREARDSDEHPNSTPIVIAFDVTGSMGRVPMTMQEKLPDLMGLLVRGGYVDDPQIAVAAIGDADSDAVPIQFGQFESDNRIDDQIREIFLEGNGGGQKSESYEMLAWFVGNRVSTDAWDKRNKKGYLFIIGDEMNKPTLKALHMDKYLGESVSENVSVEEIYNDLKERWNVYYILPNLTFYFNDSQVIEHWRNIVGQNLLRLEDPDVVCELIATTIGLEEEAISLDEGLANISTSASKAVGTVLADRDLVGAGAKSTAVDLGGFDTVGTDEY